MKLSVLAIAALCALTTNATAATLNFSTNCAAPGGTQVMNFGPVNAPTTSGTSATYSAASFNQGTDPGCGGSFLSLGGTQNTTNTTSITFTGPISYFGFQWGTPDSYNTVQVYSGANLLATYVGFNTGTQTFNPGYSASNGYANITAGVGETFTRIVMTSTALAFETDNHSFILSGVPEPSTYISVLTAGSALLALRRRSRKA